MGIGKQHPAPRQPVYVGRLGLGMAAQHADPIVQIVNGDEQIVGRTFASLRAHSGGHAIADQPKAAWK
jgi:hypothetical protein